MKITQSTAMNIVTEMKKIIGEDLTFMDTTCHIIACTDPGRIGIIMGLPHGDASGRSEGNVCFG